MTQTKPKLNRVKDHTFTLIVKTTGTRASAELAVLSAFAKRQPDGCLYLLKRKHKCKP